MFFPLKICKLKPNEIDLFKKYYAKDNQFIFEGVWFRSQEEKNKDVSLWKDSNSHRRRTIHFKHTFTVIHDDLCMTESYLYLSTRLPIEEYQEYVKGIKQALKNNNYSKKDNQFIKEDLSITLEEFEHHPKEKPIENYRCIDIIVCSTNYKDIRKNYEQLWNLQVKGIREKDSRGNPKYIHSLEEIEEYFPAQVELGCGPSIEAGIAPLYSMHELYKVQRHSDGVFYFGAADDLIIQIIEKDVEKYKDFASIIKNCMQAKPTKFHECLKKMYEKNLLVGTLFNNNFDHLSSILQIKEQTLRVYTIENYFPKVEFDKKAKSLICIGTHADRRFIQKQAREKNLKIIYVDPEGFFTKDGFESYLIEGAQDEDFILRMCAQEFADLVEKTFFK